MRSHRVHFGVKSVSVKVKRVIFRAVFAVKQQIVTFVGADDVARKDDILAVAHVGGNVVDCCFGRNVFDSFVTLD